MRLLVLNTNLYYDQNKQTQNAVDPVGQFHWMDRVLTEAAKKKEKAKNFDALKHYTKGVRCMRDLFI